MLSTIEQARGNSINPGTQMLYLLTFTEVAIVCDFTIILKTIPSVIFEKRHICQCGSYPFTDCWGLKHENRFKPFTAFWISKFSFHFISACIMYHQIDNSLKMTVLHQIENSLEMTVSHQIEKSLEMTAPPN